jgi:hypothetical protein
MRRKLTASAAALVAGGSAHAATINATPASIQAVAAQAKAGDTIVFGSGTYALGSAINLRSGVSYIKSPGAILTSTSGNNMMAGSNISGVTICRLTFKNGPNVADAAHGAIDLTDANKVTVTNNAFRTPRPTRLSCSISRTI